MSATLPPILSGSRVRLGVSPWVFEKFDFSQALVRRGFREIGSAEVFAPLRHDSVTLWSLNNHGPNLGAERK